MKSKILLSSIIFLLMCSSVFPKKDIKKKIETDLKKLVEFYMKDFNNIKGSEQSRDEKDLITYNSNYTFTNSVNTNNIITYYLEEWTYIVKIEEGDENLSFQELQDLSDQIEEVLNNIKFNFGKLENVGENNYIYTGTKKVNEKVSKLHIQLKNVAEQGYIRLVIDDAAFLYDDSYWE